MKLLLWKRRALVIFYERWYMGRRHIDLTGQTINGIYVNGLVNEKGGAGKHKRWYCTCPICKQIFIVASQHLRDKTDPISMCSHCSLRQYNDLSGQEFGRLFVVSRDWESKNKRIRYVCKCECGSIVSVQENHLLDGATKSCGCLNSGGEEDVSSLLSAWGIGFIRQKQFDDCKYKGHLKFDFYLPQIHTVIEYQGIQHFEPVKFFGGEDAFRIRQRRDRIKRDYCVAHDIRFAEIRYDEDIEIALKKILSNEDIVLPHGNVVG